MSALQSNEYTLLSDVIDSWLENVSPDLLKASMKWYMSEIKFFNVKAKNEIWFIPHTRTIDVDTWPSMRTANRDRYTIYTEVLDLRSLLMNNRDCVRDLQTIPKFKLSEFEKHVFFDKFEEWLSIIEL